MEKWSSQLTQLMQLHREAWKKIQDFNRVWTCDLAITGAMLYQLSYEATDVGSRSIVGSYVPVREMSVNDIWNESYVTAEMNHMWLRKWNETKWSSQLTQFMQLRKEAWKNSRTSKGFATITSSFHFISEVHIWFISYIINTWNFVNRLKKNFCK